MATKKTKKVELEHKINDEWIVFRVAKLHFEEGLSFQKIRLWFKKHEGMDHPRSFYHRKWDKWKETKKSLNHQPDKFVPVLPKPPLTFREKQVKKNGNALGNAQRENRRLKAKNDLLLKAVTGDEEGQLMDLTELPKHEKGEPLARRINRIKSNNYEILDTVKKLGLRGIATSTYKTQAAKAMDLAKFLDKIIPLEDRAAAALLEMEDKGRVPRTGKKEDMEKPVTFNVNVKPRPAMDDFEGEINVIQKGNDNE